MAKIRICKEEGCHNSATTGGFCRLHYLKNWKKIKDEKHQRAADRLNKYIERIVEKYPERYVDVLKKEIRSKNFEKAIEDEFGNMDLDDVYHIFNDPGYQDEIETLIKNLKVEDEFK